MGKTLDLRTYLLLERAFARRLQRSWEKLSAPIYEKITQACIDHNWDKARLLVTDLDMTEVGTQNREWITYMLLSCAVFGAGTVAKGQPSFVGVGSFDTFLKQTTNNIIQYLEFTATAQVQAEALQSIAEDEAKTKAPKVAFDPNQPRDEKGRWVDTEGVIHVGDFVELYHGTSRLRANKILKEGFKIRAVAKQTMGGDPESSRNYIWFAKRLEAAKGYSEMHRHPAVVTVRLPQALYEGFKLRHSGPVSVWSPEPIPAKFIHRGTQKWEEAQHPRDEEGQFAVAGQKRRPVEVFAKGEAPDGDQILFPAEDYSSTRFILPDGRLLGSFSDSHWDSAQHLGVDMYEAMRAGVLRFSGGNGAEIGHTITKVQAQHLIDASVQSGGNQPLHMDVFMGKERDAKTFDPDRDTADTVRNWVNKHFKKSYVSILKFDEAKHPRDPAGTSEGGQFTESGRTGVPTPDPVLAEQAKKGIEAVEKLLPIATKEAKYERINIIPTYWGDVDSDVQQRVYEKWREEAGDQSPDTSQIDRDYREELGRNNEKILEEAQKEMLSVTEHRFSLASPVGMTVEEMRVKRALDPDTVEYADDADEDGYVPLNMEMLRFKDGTVLTAEEQKVVEGVWRRQYDYAFEEAFDRRYDDEEYNDRVRELESEMIDEQWSEMGDKEKLGLLENYGMDVMGPVRPGEPDQWVTGIEEGTHGDDDYSRTHAIALKLSELRTDEIRKERGLLEPTAKPKYTVSVSEVPPSDDPSRTLYVAKDTKGRIVGTGYSEEMATRMAEKWATDQSRAFSQIQSKDMIRDIWDAWKGSSSQGLSLSMQLAAAQELNGLHRLSPSDVEIALQNAERYGGMENLKAYVRAQWEVTQTVMAKAKQDKIEVYRGLMLAGETVNATPHEYINSEGKIVAPSNITVIQRVDEWSHKETPVVKFNFNEKEYEINKVRKPDPWSWTEVDPAMKQQVEAEWKKDIEDVEVAGVPKGRALEIGEGLLDKLPDYKKLEMLLDYQRAGRIPLLPYESDQEAITRRLDEVVTSRTDISIKLPALNLKRAGAQSTTGTAQVANQWNGVGDPPPDAKRVVLRIAAPSTSVLSLPVYGQNIQEEHESVLIGTKDKWLWDAWQKKAPQFTEQPIVTTARKADQKPLVIDLQAEDRNKPHWMSSVEWANVLKWDESRHPRDEEGQFTRVAMTSQRPEGDPGHQPNKEVFQHMREFHERLQALPGVSHVSVKPGVGGWEGGSESMWQIYYKGNGAARKLVAQTAKTFNQDAVLILNKCTGKDCQPAVELSFEGGITPPVREHVHRILVKNGIGGWTWMKRNGKTILRMVSVPQWGGEAEKHQQATAVISKKLRDDGLKNHRRVHKVAVSVMEREGANSYDAIIG